MATWIKATDRLPLDSFKNVIVRHLRTREVGLGKTMGHQSQMMTDFVGWNSTKGDCEFKDIEWLDESESSPTTTVGGSVEEAGNKYAAEVMGDYSPELQEDYDSIKAHFLAGAAHAQQSPSVDIDKIVEPLIICLKGIANNYDCDTDAHKYNTTCRKCDALETLSWWEVEKPKQNIVTVDIVEALDKSNPYIGNDEMCDIIQNTCQLLIGIKPDAVEEKWWSDWDESVLQSLISALKKLQKYYGKQMNITPPSIK